MIIDTHAHIGTLPPFDMTIEQVLYSMDKYGIDFTILSNIEGAENDHQQNPVPPPCSKPQNQLLRETIDAVRPYPDRLGIMPWLRIQHELPDEEFVSLLKENHDIIYGIKLHPFHSLTAPDEERLEPIYRLAAEFNLPIASHTARSVTLRGRPVESTSSALMTCLTLGKLSRSSRSQSWTCAPLRVL